MCNLVNFLVHHGRHTKLFPSPQSANSKTTKAIKYPTKYCGFCTDIPAPFVAVDDAEDDAAAVAVVLPVRETSEQPEDPQTNVPVPPVGVLPSLLML